ncbi:MAG TPA: DUF6345 domain-containing protein [Nocardioides sp.]|uniref:DUF6345 domain-containing protein n=1 Tax=Nocardioides sp. TaxID=35761 RepID=UPI002C7D3563|nr:DUF6345 domain-containing protein [Nocardioides sp.]HQR27107.1 DUF6345 domain-containing protein [Nocardioides sp.]
MGSIGIEWVQSYHGLAGDLSNTRAQAEGFYNTLAGVRQFSWGDDLAWDQDFETQGLGTPSSGTDTSWADNVDAVFFSGHGSSSRFYFGRTIDDAYAKSTEIRWGDLDLELIALDACNVLERDGVFDRWGWPCFAGLHYILGFHTVTGDEADRGRLLAQYLNAGSTVREAWIRAAQDTEDSDTEWAYLRADAAGTSTYTDHWWGAGPVSADPVSPTVLYYARAAC